MGHTSVKLDKHLGHTMTVAGSRTHESKAHEKAEEKKEGEVEKASSKEEYRRSERHQSEDGERDLQRANSIRASRSSFWRTVP
jgi:hypothetical protein